jgi:hypothetical protein
MNKASQILMPFVIKINQVNLMNVNRPWDYLLYLKYINIDRVTRQLSLTSLF